ncbi:carboxylesterase/lipase family protein [Mycolicibacterium holsaticum]|uniref:carboxylesterase/lipase family protein n=1 Tax=Mycolicibacterium holsaticum TaxID=152142 RepID=UPI001C7DC1DF|nr:carboxylesterase/lipase family protein [Mycolicibacterium holsaticum]MDA4107634.1 carboxylesterase [Mycolicibacterium holsaticum DSM 44478 = JCM 12374]QZA14905.1 carboxylesterase/lipase family protein [Mycolicibacterium holsaticum DSM 44478 = JCM 12374]UNC07657.1 carboxylesterase/lipase family protein [Mycolicibacterium holsaticum DSM 44478 = JCM 12374]
MTADAGRGTDHALVVDTACGPVRGIDDGTVKFWKGVRYAAAPVGELRWRAPEPPPRWTEPLDATRVGPVCPQPTDPKIPIDLGAPQGDDCLTLNVWASSDTAAGAAKPVMVWIHGGAYILGSSAQPLYHGRALASAGEAIIVTVNYRLGALGFLDLSSLGDQFATNIGIRDVLFALQWVRDNIAAFGGDPGRVTVFGESAGGGIVTTLLASPPAAGLFGAAIAQSSPATSVYDRERGSRVAEQFLDALGMRTDEAYGLASVPIAAVNAAAKRVFDAVPASTPGTLAFAPIIDGDVVPAHPVKLAREGRTHPVPLLIGTNRHEAALFRWMKSPLMPITPQAIRDMFATIAAEQPALQLPSEAQIRATYRGRPKIIGMRVARDIGFRMPSIWFAEGHRDVAPVYLYRFDFATPMLRLLRLGAAHATELPYVWGNLVAGPKDPTFKLGGLKAGRVVSARMRTRWLNFAVDAAPAGRPGDPQWRPYRADERSTLVIDAEDRLVEDLDADVRTAWGDQVLSFR